jgi:hypothetical protein
MKRDPSADGEDVAGLHMIRYGSASFDQRHIRLDVHRSVLRLGVGRDGSIDVVDRPAVATSQVA